MNKSLILCLLLAGCTTLTEPVMVSQDTYLITLNSRGGFSNHGELMTEVLQKANSFCAQKDRSIKVLDSSDEGAQGWTPINQKVTFQCVPKAP